MMIAPTRWIASSQRDDKTHRGTAAHSFPVRVHHGGHGKHGVNRKVTTKKVDRLVPEPMTKTHRGTAAHSFPVLVHHGGHGKHGVNRKATTKKVDRLVPEPMTKANVARRATQPPFPHRPRKSLPLRG